MGALLKHCEIKGGEEEVEEEKKREQEEDQKEKQEEKEEEREKEEKAASRSKTSIPGRNRRNCGFEVKTNKFFYFI